MHRIIALAASLLLAPLSVQALTVNEVIALHEAHGQPFRHDQTVLDATTRADLARQLAGRDPAIAADVMAALETRFDGAVIHAFQQENTSLISQVVALEIAGEVVLLHLVSWPFFEHADIVALQLDLFQTMGAAMLPAPLPADWAEATSLAAMQAAMDWADGDRAGPYPGMVHEDRGGQHVLARAMVPDWVTITISAIEGCPPRYPVNGWILVFVCTGD